MLENSPSSNVRTVWFMFENSPCMDRFSERVSSSKNVVFTLVKQILFLL
jgi:hypothetical protein